MTIQILSAPVSHAVRVYLAAIKKDVDHRDAYNTAIELAGLNTATERAQLRNAITGILRQAK